MGCKPAVEAIERIGVILGASRVTSIELAEYSKLLGIPTLSRYRRTPEKVGFYTMFQRICQNANVQYDYVMASYTQAPRLLSDQSYEDVLKDARKMQALAAENNIFIPEKLTKKDAYGLALLYRQYITDPAYKNYSNLHQVIPQDLREMKFYHGTPTKNSGDDILRDGAIKPPVITTNHYQTPVEGKAYLASDPSYALIYGLGGAYAGHKVSEHMLQEKGQYGYVFEIAGGEFDEIQPDEDCIGEYISGKAVTERDKRMYERYRSERGKESLAQRYQESWQRHNAAWVNSSRQWLGEIAWEHLTENQQRALADYDAPVQSAVGKKIVKLLTDAEKFDLVRQGAHVAHHGELHPIHAYRIDKLQSQAFDKDGRNIFDVAEAVL